jgi:hypothetical protein
MRFVDVKHHEKHGQDDSEENDSQSVGSPLMEIGANLFRVVNTPIEIHLPPLGLRCEPGSCPSCSIPEPSKIRERSYRCDNRCNEGAKLSILSKSRNGCNRTAEGQDQSVWTSGTSKCSQHSCCNLILPEQRQ